MHFNLLTSGDDAKMSLFKTLEKFSWSTFKFGIDVQSNVAISMMSLVGRVGSSSFVSTNRGIPVL